MSTPPASKRRRVDSIGTGIHKPFVSPLKRNNSSNKPANTTTTTSPTSKGTSKNENGTHSPATATTTPAKASRTSTPYTPIRSSNLRNTLLNNNTTTTTTSTSPATQSQQDPEITLAQQEIKRLEQQIRDLRTQTSTLDQATQLHSTSAPPTSHSTSSPAPQHQQSRLSRLTEKWKRASQAAAEQVYTDFCSRINDNGGYKVFLQQQRSHSLNTFNAFTDDETPKDDGKEARDNEEDWRDEMGDCLTERAKRQRRSENEEMMQGQLQTSKKKREIVQESDGESEREEDEQDEEELTMASMLQVLNIPPETIGWNVKTQNWD
jgi:Swi5-dependent recombination DNA repair protein 1